MVHDIWAVSLQLSNFNILVAVLGGFVSLFGIVSYLPKENYYLSEALGVGFGPNGANFIRPRDYAECNQKGVSVIECRDNLNAITLNFSRLVLGVQLVLAGVQLPSKLQNLFIAESGTNDGLGYLFFFFALYLIKYVGSGAAEDSAGDAMGLWFGFTWGYTIILSVLYGAAVGWVGKKLLHWAEERNYVDRESFLVFAIALALFVLGTCGLVGTDDVLACFIAGNTFTWDDWFRLQTKDDSLQPTIDMLLNVTIFLWYGAYLPWDLFGDNNVISTWRLVVLGLLVLLLRRLPWVPFSWGSLDPSTSAIFYLFVSMEFIEEHLSDADGIPRSDVKDLGETIRVVVWFLAVCSIVVHGLSIPLGKAGYLAPRAFGRVLSETLSDEPRAVKARRRIPVLGKYLVRERRDLESRHVQRTSVISRPLDLRHPHSETNTSVDSLQAAVVPSRESHIEVDSRSVTQVPVQREREIPFRDETQRLN
ncbi:hypothetical protein N7532_009841 [Penicillium argentinense]|uniref:Cation/H+ exchanger transmembrane domain-containing protein n=1 Tax=Penicillium argentinense TaxID=1131581 RepID=A0A9W9ENM9_9EURO|nr:uncharacterized protein N7532_009841 [Penicillium argentinense]KAJ5085070.1 hypothetical protein N7532_009841 [Penicillium argentinense]